MFDLRGAHGVMLGVAVPHIGHQPPVTAPNEIWRNALALARTPRVCRIQKDELGIFLELDAKDEKMFKLSRDDVLGRRSSDFVHPEDQGMAISAWMQMISTPGLARRIRRRHLRGDGSYLWVEITNTHLLTSPEFSCVLADVLDISEGIRRSAAWVGTSS
jgi:PAS domain S-box-containing protein